jgi:hypothetical protein
VARVRVPAFESDKAPQKVVSQEEQPTWANVRRNCMLGLLRAGCAAEAPALFEKVDRYAATIPGDVARERFVFVAQAVIMQRLRGDVVSRDQVRAELVIERAPMLQSTEFDKDAETSLRKIWPSSGA